MKISMAPLPTWKQLVSLFYTKAMDEQSLLRPWLRDNDHGFMFSKSAWSLQAILYWWEKVTHKHQAKVWLPDYFCNQSLMPLRETSAEIFFYPVDTDFNPDWRAIEKMSIAPPDLFILVHYFGIAANAKSAKNFCKLHNALLIEDAAHILTPFNQIGELADFVLYSPHKLLAMPDGAICVMRPSCKRYAENAISEMNEIKLTTQSKTFFPWKWLVKRIIQKIIPSHFYQSQSPDFYQKENPVNLSPSQPSHLAKKLLQLHLPMLDSIIQKRKYLAALWQYLLEKHAQILPVATNNQLIPYLALFNGQEAAYSLYTHFKNSNLPVSTWPDLPGEISADAIASKLRNTLFNLPVHHSLNPSYLIKKFNPYKNSDAIYAITEIFRKEEWENYFNQINQSNLLQLWSYGDAKISHGWQVKRILIKKNYQIIALAQILQKNILSFGKVTRINRGPLWLIQPLTEDVVNVYRLIKNEFNVFKAKIAFVAPELLHTSRNQIILETANYTKRKTPNWHSAWIDLSASVDRLRSQLDGKWRNQLKSAEKALLVFQLVNSNESFENLINHYIELQKNKGFSGIPVDLLRQMYLSDSANLFIAEVILDKQVIAGAMLIKHGTSCTYTIGWTSECGRKNNAMNFLLWNGLLAMKDKNINWFDVGGIDEIHNRSVAKFKKGLNGEEYSLMGEYCLW